MELDLINALIDLNTFTPKEIEEALEDPFSIRFLPDHNRQDGESRYYMIGRTVGNRFLFLAFSTDGKKARIYGVREMADVEKRFYDRKYAEYK